jgi:glycosyltransferase involved in cell wall biosynthesis
MKVVICANTTWNLVNFRSSLIKALLAQGHEVIAVAPIDDYAHRLTALGCRYVPMPMDNKGTHPVHDAALAWRFLRLFWREKPDVFLSYTIKPNIYGSLAAHLAGVSVINNIAGLGSAFLKNNWLTALVKKLYKFALTRSIKVFFQNRDDEALFIESQLVNRNKTAVLPGSGVDLNHFYFSTIDKPLSQPFRFLLIARMLRDKGVAEFAEAAKIIRQERPDVEFCLLGFLDSQNPTAISTVQMQAWVTEGHIQYLGSADDVRPEIEHADCIVLPSYREGTPRTLLEAAAMGRPIITTDAVGCRDVVDDGVNGLLCEVRSASDLSLKMRQMLNLSPQQRNEMGLQGRKKIEHAYDENIVIQTYLATINTLMIKVSK